MNNKEEILKLYERTKEDTPSLEYREKIRAFEEYKEEFLIRVGEQNRDDVEELTYLRDKANNELRMQDFDNGFSLAIKLIIEAVTIKKE